MEKWQKIQEKKNQRDEERRRRIAERIEAERRERDERNKTKDKQRNSITFKKGEHAPRFAKSKSNNHNDDDGVGTSVVTAPKTNTRGLLIILFTILLHFSDSKAKD